MIEAPPRTECSVKQKLDWFKQGDLESVALHELGHAHLLNHTRNSENVMIRPGVLDYRRSIPSDDSNGGNHISELSSISNDVGCPNFKMILTNCASSTSSDIAKVFKGYISYPNPSFDVVNVSFDSSTSGRIVLFDHFGRELLTNDFSGSGAALDLHTLPTGIYYLRIHLFGGTFSSSVKLHKI
jgi:Secretion system C-terminal sorting domain